MRLVGWSEGIQPCHLSQRFSSGISGRKSEIKTAVKILMVVVNVVVVYV